MTDLQLKPLFSKGEKMTGQHTLSVIKHHKNTARAVAGTSGALLLEVRSSVPA